MLNFVGPELASGRFVSKLGSDNLTKLQIIPLKHKLGNPSIHRRKYSVTYTFKGLAISSPLGNNVPMIVLFPALKHALERKHRRGDRTRIFQNKQYC